jgi:hypothetical protein
VNGHKQELKVVTTQARGGWWAGEVGQSTHCGILVKPKRKKKKGAPSPYEQVASQHVLATLQPACSTFIRLLNFSNCFSFETNLDSLRSTAGTGTLVICSSTLPAELDILCDIKQRAAIATGDERGAQESGTNLASV